MRQRRMPRLRSLSRRCRRNDREQQIGSMFASEMQPGDAAENIGRPVDGVIVQKGSATFQLVLEIRQPPTARSAIFAILAGDGERESIARRHYDLSRLNRDIEYDNLAACQR